MSIGSFRVEWLRGSVLRCSIAASLIAAACSGSESDAGPGGSAGNAGASASAGAPSIGGAPAAGATNRGGAPAIGGGSTAGEAGEAGAVTAGEAGEAGAAGFGGEAGSDAAGGAGGSASGAGGASGGGAGGAPGAGAGGACNSVSGCPPVILATAPYAYGLAIDDSYVYWSTYETSGNIARVPIAGGTVQPISTGENKPFDITVAAGKVFWCQLDDAGGHVTSASVTGGNRLQMAPGVAPGPARVQSDGTYVYYVTAYNVLMRLAIAGGLPSVLDDQEGYNSNVQDVRLYQGKLYYTNDGIWKSDYSAKLAGTAAIRSLNVSGTPTVSGLVTNLDYPQFTIAVDGTHVFWNDEEYIYSTSILGGIPKKVAPVPTITPTFPVSDMASDGTNLYFMDAHSVYRVPVGGGEVQTVSSGWIALKKLALDATHLYFTDNGDKLVTPGKIVELAK